MYEVDYGFPHGTRDDDDVVYGAVVVFVSMVECIGRRGFDI